MGKVALSQVSSPEQHAKEKEKLVQALWNKGEKGEVCCDACSVVGVNKNGRRGIQNSQ